MQTNNPEPLPKTLPGVLCRQWVSCGKPNCRCRRGRPHGPYHYRFWREGGRLRKAYLRAEEVSEAQARCDARRQALRELRAAWATWRELVTATREVERP